MLDIFEIGVKMLKIVIPLIKENQKKVSFEISILYKIDYFIFEDLKI
jgi:hypothetical protein